MTAIVDHWLTSAQKVVSPNFNERPENASIDLLVIHNISLPAGEFGGGHIAELFTNCLDCQLHPSFTDLEGLELSAHLLIDRQGDVTQFVPFDQRAWHAGASCHCGRENCNDFSIGIELEGTDDCPYTERQYRKLAEVAEHLLASYPDLCAESVVGHSDIAPARKTDPGPAFNWDYFRSLIGKS